MQNDIQKHHLQVERIKSVTFAIMCLSIVSGIVFACFPIDIKVIELNQTSDNVLPPQTAKAFDVDSVIRTSGLRPIIKPAQIVHAVKDDGTMKVLMEKN